MDVILRPTTMPEFTAAFDAYIDGAWTGWAETERPRRRSIAFYNRLYETQQRIVAMGDDRPIECVFGVGMARWNHPLGAVNVPLIEALVEIDLDPGDGSLVMRPRAQAPKVCLRAFENLEIESGCTDSSRRPRNASRFLPLCSHTASTRIARSFTAS